MGELLSIASGILGAAAFLFYAIDVVKGRAKPARGARLMLTTLLILALLQQDSLGSSWTIAVTAGETLGSLGILSLALKYGVGGFRRLDIVCYILLAADVLFWLFTSNALWALCLSVVADLIAFTPTLVKTWHHPKTETMSFYIMGIIAPVLSIVGGGNYSFGVAVFPAYLALANACELLLISGLGRRLGTKTQTLNRDYQQDTR